MSIAECPLFRPRAVGVISLILAIALIVAWMVYFGEHPDVVYRIPQTADLDDAKFVPGGLQFVTGQRGKPGAALWSPESEKPLWTFGEDVACLAISRSGKLVATGGAQDHVSIWDLEKRVLLRDCERNNAMACSMVFSRDEKYLYVGTGIGLPIDANGGKDRECDICEVGVDTGRIVRRLGVHQQSVTGLDCSADGQFLVSGTGLSVAVWSLQSGKQIWRTREEPRVFSPSPGTGPTAIAS
jgi:WD40 repeat protein